MAIQLTFYYEKSLTWRFWWWFPLRKFSHLAVEGALLTLPRMSACFLVKPFLEKVGSQPLFLWWSCHHKRRVSGRTTPTCWGHGQPGSVWERSWAELCARKWNRSSRDESPRNSCFLDAPLFKCVLCFSVLFLSVRHWFYLAFSSLIQWLRSWQNVLGPCSVPPVPVCRGLHGLPPHLVLPVETGCVTLEWRSEIEPSVCWKNS